MDSRPKVALALMFAAVVAVLLSLGVTVGRRRVAPATAPQGAGPLLQERSARLTVAAAHPQGPTEGDARPTITFDRPVAPLATVEELRKLPAPGRIEPAVAGEWRWLGSSTVEFAPEKPLPLATHFVVTVEPGLTAIDGTTLAAPWSFDFSTPAPRVTEVDPAEGWRWLGANARFALTFDQPVTGLEGRVRLVAKGVTVPVRVAPGVRVIEEEYAAASKSAQRWLRSRLATDQRTRYVVAPEVPLPLAAGVELSIDPGVHGAAGPLEVEGDRRWTFLTHGRMQVTGARACRPARWDRDAACPFGPLVLATSNTADAKTLRKLLTIVPRVELDWDHAEGQAADRWDSEATPVLVIPGKFRPGTTYQLTLAPGLPDEFGQRGDGWRGSFSTTDMPKEFDLGASEPPSIALVEAEGDGALPLRSSNVDALDLRFWRLSPAEIARFVASRADKVPTGTPVAQRLATNAGHNTSRTQPLSVRRLLGGARTGLFFLAADFGGDGKEAQHQRVLGQLTNLAVHAKLGVTSGAVWVTRVSDGAPVAGAEVVLHEPDGSARWRGRTDAGGVALTAGIGEQDSSYGWDVKRLVSASKDGDTGVALAAWESGLYPGAFELEQDYTGGRPRVLGSVMAERGIYRPGEKVHLKALLRYRAMGRILTPPAGTRVTLKVVTSRDAVALEKEVALSRFGTCAVELDVPEDAPLGTWQASVQATIGGQQLRLGGDFRVETYRAPQFRVDVSERATHVAAGEPVQAQVMARYLFGAALADAPVRWTVVRSTLDFRPPRHDGYAFGVQVWWWDDDEPAPSSDVFASGRGRTDAVGAFALDAGKAEAPADRTWEYAIEAEAEDVNRQRVADQAQVIVHPASLYAGIKRPSGFAEAGKPLPFELVAVTPEGERRSAKVAVEVRRREWKWIKKKVAGDRWTTVSEPVEEPVGRCEASVGEVAGSCAVTPAQPGFHVVEARVTDPAGRRQLTRTSVYVTGGGWVAWQRDDTDKIELVPDKELYEVGDTARILVKSPWPEAEALLSVEREGVMSARRVRLTGAAAILEVPVGEEAVPNVFVGLVLTRGRVADRPPTVSDDPGRPAVKLGYAQLKVERRTKRLSVTVTPDATERRPRDTVKLDLQVKDSSGRGTPAELTVWAVDESVLRLTGYKLPDLIEALHPLRGLGVRTGEPLLHLVLRKLYREKGATPGGGGGGPEGAAIRSLFKTTPLFAPEVVTDANGRAHVEFQLPDNLTTFRIMAVAVTEGDRAGGGESGVTVSRPLIALPALPRAARVGDRFEAGVVVHSPGAKLGQVDVTAEVQGLRLDGAPTQRVALPGGKPREVRFSFVAERPGTALLRFHVRGGAERDGVEQRLPVTLPVAVEAVAVQGDTEGTSAEALRLPADVRPEVGGLELSLSSSVLGGFSRGMTQLVEYPYGCLEQLSSRLVPFVALRELAGRSGLTQASWLMPSPTDAEPGAVVGTSPDDVVRRTIEAIEARQRPDGGYRFWDEDACADEWTSSWAVLALGRAGAAGYAVDLPALERGKGFLAGTVLAGRCTPCLRGCTPPNDPTRIFALYALARTGSPRGSYHGELLSRRGALPLFSRAMLADALARGGDRARAAAVLAELLNAAKVTGAEVHFEEPAPSLWAARWGSDVRTTGMALQALLSLQPNHPYVTRMATYLSRARGADGRFRSTQEAAFALMALSELALGKEPEVPDFTAVATLGGKPLASQRFRGRSLDVFKARVALGELPRAGASGPLPLQLRRDGKAGRLYYTALLRTAPKALPVDALERGLHVQRGFEPWAGGGAVRSARAGEVLRARLRVSTPQERRFVVVEVPLPSGLEAVDTSLATTSKLPGGARRGEEAGEADGETPAPYFWTPFNHVEVRDDRVLLFADWLPAGSHAFTLAVRATTPGRFLMAPARAEEMYSPEVFGRSDAGEFDVAAPR